MVTTDIDQNMIWPDGNQESIVSFLEFSLSMKRCTYLSYLVRINKIVS